MKKETARDMWTRLLKLVNGGCMSASLTNPGIVFTQQVKRGLYDDLPDAEYHALLHDFDQMAHGIWGVDNAELSASDALINAISATNISEKDMEAIIDILAESSSHTFYATKPETRNRTAPDDVCGADGWTPREIYDALSEKIRGQDDAVKAAAMVMFNTLNKRRCNAIFHGPTGSGKTEIWRQLGYLFKDSVRIADASQLIAEGWRGGVHLSDILFTLTPRQIEKGVVLVLDECDKIVCEPAVGGGGTDYNLLVQNNLLTLMDGGTLEFTSTEGRKAFSVDCSRISVVMTGCFERLNELKKLSEKPRLGFSSESRGTGPDASGDGISAEDLIRAGMRREVAGRVSKIAKVNPLTIEDFARIGQQEVERLAEQIRREINIDPGALVMLARIAEKKGLGARWMKQTLQNILDGLIFDDPDAETYRLEYEPPDADERRQAAAYAVA